MGQRPPLFRDNSRERKNLARRKVFASFVAIYLGREWCTQSHSLMKNQFLPREEQIFYTR